jgi:hypothetical protein
MARIVLTSDPLFHRVTGLCELQRPGARRAGQLRCVRELVRQHPRVAAGRLAHRYVAADRYRASRHGLRECAAQCVVVYAYVSEQPPARSLKLAARALRKWPTAPAQRSGSLFEALLGGDGLFSRAHRVLFHSWSHSRARVCGARARKQGPTGIRSAGVAGTVPGMDRGLLDPRHLVAVSEEEGTVAAPAGLRIEPADFGTPLLAGFTAAGPTGKPVLVGSFDEFAKAFGSAQRGPFAPGAALPHAVRGFFRNGGHACWVQRIGDPSGSGQIDADALKVLLESSAPVVAVPDAHGLSSGGAKATELQRLLVAAADQAQNRMVIIDPPPGLTADEVILWRRRTGIDSPAAVSYYPWIEVLDGPSSTATTVPPSGHILGSWVRIDNEEGPHRAPTGQSLLGVDGVSVALSASDQRQLNREGVNCVRAFPGPEPRVWGARTFSSEPDWRYVHRRRTYTNLLVSIAQGTRWVEDEPLDEALLQRLRAAIAGFLHAAWRRGALQGASARQAFFVECERADATSGAVVVELGLALCQPGDYRVLRMVMRNDAAA